jgi:peptidyl-prolyl cis-trans isomerase D
VVQTRAGDQIWFEVANVEPARQRSFAEVKAAVEAAWRKEETARRLAAKADELVKALAGGSTMEQVAAQAGNAPIKHIADVRRTGTEGLSAAVVSKVFDTAVTGAGSAEGDADTRVVFKVLDSVVPPMDPDSPQAKQVDQQYRSWLSDGVLTAYLSRLQDSVGVQINPEVLRSASGDSS